jgi:DNA-binding transcriptional MerR regulator
MPKEELLTVAAVARRLGVAPSTLRTWDRRYGLGPSEHSTGEHRRYCPLDVAKLMMMRRLISTGVTPSEAAQRACAQENEQSCEVVIPEFEARDELVVAIYKAAQSFDIEFIDSELRRDVAKYGVNSTWSQVIAPVLVLVGKIWEETGKGIEVEHLLTEMLKRILRDCAQTSNEPINARPVLLAAVGNELHCLALHALAAALAERGIESHFLGSRTPLEAISRMVTRSAPPAIFLWAQLEENALPEYFRDLPAVRPAPRIVLGGPGWNRDSCTGAVFVEDLSQACLEIERAVGV